MMRHRGWWLPDGDIHMRDMLTRGETLQGRATYQMAKYIRGLQLCQGRRQAVDVGAHVGLWSWLMQRDFDRVAAFEPLPRHIECFKLNGLHPEKVHLMPFAISDHEERLSILPVQENSGHSHVVEPGTDTGEVSVQAYPLDYFRLGDVDLLKIDVEGWELQVVRGAEETIRRCRPLVILEQKRGNAEMHSGQQYAARNQLVEWGGREVAMVSGDHFVQM